MLIADIINIEENLTEKFLKNPFFLFSCIFKQLFNNGTAPDTPTTLFKSPKSKNPLHSYI